MLNRFYELLLLVLFIIVLNVIIGALDAILGPIAASALLLGTVVAFMAYYVVYGDSDG